ncbi:tape measure protein [Rahnella sp. NRRL B-41462]|uniref:tape measure protein n=1 Tax=Rahnella sp. NRRL B-41462 TaxID=1610579 RepID=UPI0018E54762|nr:tape measure protein [Rahnella sp. NRRL B-41462]
MNRTERSIATVSKIMSGLTNVAKGVAAAISIQQITAYGNAWVTVSNKLVNSVKANEDLFTITQRVFDISQDTRSSLEATATLYGRLERATRSAGTSTADLVKLTETINKGLTVSGATTEEASSTMTQLSQALASGVLRGEEFNSISENGSRLAQALASSLGVTIGQLRAMAAQGKLTTEVVVNGLLKQSDQIAQEFSNTTLTMSQAFTVATNNITKFVGEASSVNTTLNVFNQGVITLSENLDTVATVIGGFALIMGGRFVGALAAATSARITDTLAAQAQATATAQAAAAAEVAATVTTRKALLDKEAAISSLALAQAEYNVAKGSAAEAFALENLNTIKSVAIQRSATFAEAQIAQASAIVAASTAAAAATTTIGSLARGALSLIGGPAGAAVIAGAAIFYFFQKAQQAKQESIDFADKLDGLIGKMKEMSQIQLTAEIDKANKSIAVQNGLLSNNEATLSGLNARLEEARKAVAGMSQSDLLYASAVDNLNTLQSEQIQLTAQVERERNKLSQTISKTGILQAQANGTFAQGIDLLKRDGHEAGVAAGLFNQLGDALNVAAKAKDNFNSQSLIVGVSAAGQKQLDQLTQENELLQITDKRLRAVKSARLDAINAGEGNQNVINQVGELAGANYDLQQAEAARNKAAKAGAKIEDEGAKKIADLQRQLEYLKLSYDENSREAAVYNAVQSAGSKATELQKQAIGEYAGALFDAKQKQSDLNAAIAADPVRNADKTYSDATKQLKRQLDEGIVDQQQFNQETLKLAQDHANDIAKANVDSVMTPAAEAAGTVDPVQQLANENAQKLALIQQYTQQKILTEQQGLALMNAANTQYEQQRIAAQWQIYRNQSAANSLLADAVDSLQGGASNAITGLLNGTQSLSEAFSNIGSTILNSVVSGLVDMGLQYVKNMMMGQVAATAALGATAAQATAAAGMWAPAAVSASIATMGSASTVGTTAYSTALLASKGMAVAGARKNGGPVSADSMYRVGEGDKPEIFKASNGSQYMISGDNGSVISNKDIGGSGSSGGMIQQINNFTFQNASGDQQQVATTFAKIAYEQSLRAIRDQKRPGGMLTK